MFLIYLFYYLPILLVISTIFYFSSQSTIEMTFYFKNQDKVLHFLAFFALGYSILRPLKFHKFSNKKSFLIVLLSCAMYGFLDEYHQSFVPNRSVELSDWFADMSGAFTAALLGNYILILEKKVIRVFV